MKRVFLGMLACLSLFTIGANGQVKIYTEDISNFYIAFDSIQTTNDTVTQKKYLDIYYFDKASDGLKKFIEKDIDMNNEKLSSTTLLRNIIKNKDLYIKKRYWITNTIEIQKNIIEEKLGRYKRFYPEFRDGNIIFVVGREIIGGNVSGSSLLIGAELMASENKQWAVPIVLHEYTHRQQWLFRNIDSIFSKQPVQLTQILAQSIWEGNADFMAELVYGKPLEKFYPNHYNEFGYKHEKEIWDKFKQEMFSKLTDKKGWFGGEKDFNGKKVKDIGYFMGSQICKSYYKNAKDKKKAISDMINLKLDSDEAAFQFLTDSGYASKEEITILSEKFKESKK